MKDAFALMINICVFVVLVEYTLLDKMSPLEQLLADSELTSYVPAHLQKLHMEELWESCLVAMCW